MQKLRRLAFYCSEENKPPISPDPDRQQEPSKQGMSPSKESKKEKSLFKRDRIYLVFLITGGSPIFRNWICLFKPFRYLFFHCTL